MFNAVGVFVLRSIWAVVLLLSVQSAFCQPALDSLKQRLHLVSDTQKVYLLGDISFAYRFENADSAVHYAALSRQIADLVGDSAAVARSLNDEGIILTTLNQYKRAIKNYARALAIREELGDSVRMGALHSKLGVVYQKQGEYSSAIEHQLQALRLFQALGIQGYVAVCQNNVAILHLNMGQLKRSLDMHQEALNTREMLGDRHGQAASLGNIANVFLSMGDTANASENYRRAVAVFEELNDPEAVSTNLHNWATCFQHSDPERALNMLHRALDIRRELKDGKMLASTYSALASTLMGINRTDEALPYLWSALTHARRSDVLVEQLNVYEQLALYYRSKSNADSTYYYLSQVQEIKDRTFDEDLRGDFAELQTKYETEQKEARIALLAEQNKVSDLKVRQKRTQLWLLAVAFLAFLVVASFGYFRYRSRQQARLAAEVLREREVGLKAVISATESERERIARDLHDGVGQQLSALKMGWQKFISEVGVAEKQNQNADAHKLGAALDDACSNVREISHRMMPRSLSQYGLIPAVEDMLSKSLDLTDIQYQFEHFGVDNLRFSAEIELNLYRVIQELISNILKHAKATEVSVQIYSANNQLIVMVHDNGSGFDRKKQGDGIGIKNIEGRLNTVKGTIHFERQGGTNATIRIDLEP